jgi:hypothetical protein
MAMCCEKVSLAMIVEYFSFSDCDKRHLGAGFVEELRHNMAVAPCHVGQVCCRVLPVRLESQL